MEIQRLRWIFYTDLYEGISLTQLSLFPDIEEIMLNYYEIIKLCIILDQKYFSNINALINEVQTFKDKNQTVRFPFNKERKWKTIEERNQVFNSKLTVLYNNFSMGELRNESTVYGRMLSLRFKSKLNEYILKLAFPDFNFKVDINDDGPHYPFLDYFGNGIIIIAEKENLKWKDFFKGIEIINPDTDSRIDYSRLFLLEYLIKDSIFCLTEILETITPYTTTTLFTDAFMAGIYYNLYKWSGLFEELFLFYKVFDANSYFKKVSIRREEQLMDSFFEKYDLLFNKNSIIPKFKKFQDYVCDTISLDQIIDIAEIYHKIWNCRNISDRFYNSVVKTISKPNVYYTLKNYAGEMALNFFRKSKEINREGKAYKDMINNMYFLDDDLKNDTIQFDLAVERFRINSNEIDLLLNKLIIAITRSIYDIDKFGMNAETELPLSNRFEDLKMNVNL